MSPRTAPPAVQPAWIDRARLERPCDERSRGRHAERAQDDDAPRDSRQHIAGIVGRPYGCPHRENAGPEHARPHDGQHHERKAAGLVRRETHESHQQCESALQCHHQPDALTAVRQVGPDEADHVGKSRRPAEERYGKIHGQGRGHAREMLLHQHRRRRSLDQAHGEPQQRPRHRFPAEHGLGQHAGPGPDAQVPMSTMRRSRRVMIRHAGERQRAADQDPVR